MGGIMRFALFSVLLSSLLTLSSFAKSSEENSKVLISIGYDAVLKLKQYFQDEMRLIKRTNDIALVQIPSKNLLYLSQLMHKFYGRCSGYVVESNEINEALESLEESPLAKFQRPTIRHQELVKQAIDMVQEKNLITSIQTLSSFRNRLYKSDTGVHSQEWVGVKWQELASQIPNAQVDYFQHAHFPQRSVILTIRGTKKPDEIVIVGGHGDSIAGWNPSENTHAPGADDNASGIASLSEAFRILTKLKFAPERTVKFMSYAAEEVGLRGSHEIAQSFRKLNQNVIGVVQLDMTNYSRRMEEIVIMTDFTNADQNAFLKDLIKTYLPTYTIKEDMCGYACSDHASWTRHGFPASIPFESRMIEYNPYIHTEKDTLAVTKNRAEHSVPYAKILLSYIIELSLVD